jgi:fermentation-respiration switch protein FrsA (DUF1100 family)
MIIENGVGNGNKAEVDENNQLHTFSITEDEAKAANSIGNEYNINTGTIAFSTNSSTRTTILYFKNDEDQDYVATAIAVGLGTRSATVSDAANIWLVRNPTSGSTITNANAVDINSNSNFGSNKSLKSTTLAYKGADGEGATSGGSDHALLYMTDGRLLAGLNMTIPKGSSIAIEIDGNTSGTFNVYAALIGYVKDPKNNGG